MIQEAEHWRTLDAKGETMPWYTRPCCEWLSTLDLLDKRVWEYGGGQSTLWYRRNGAEVSGVDSSLDWSNIAGLRYATGKEDYLTAITGEFDLICIDGDYRDDCFVYALNHLSEFGTIIIDNWKQASAGWPRWPETERLIREMKLKTKEFPQEGHPDWVTLTVWKDK